MYLTMMWATSKDNEIDNILPICLQEKIRVKGYEIITDQKNISSLDTEKEEFDINFKIFSSI